MQDSMLCRARRANKLTQLQLAEQVGVDQPTLARWKKGAAIPPEKASLLSAMLGVPIGAASARRVLVPGPSPDPADAQDTDEDHAYFGEVAIHFRSGGRPLMVSIDETARARLYVQFDERCLSAVVFETLDNRTVFVRKAAISDLHLSGDDVSAFGPEHARYGRAVRGMASTDDWAFADPSADGGDRDPVDAFAGRPLGWSGAFWRALSADPYDARTPADLRDAVASVLASDDARSYALLSTHMFWQVERARRRGMPCSDDAGLSDRLHALDLGIIEDDQMLHLCCGEAGGYHHSVLVAFGTLEYLTEPTHLLEDSTRAAARRDGLEA